MNRKKKPKKHIAVWECIVKEVSDKIIWCEAYLLQDPDDYVDYWEVDVSGHKWVEGDAFYVLKPVNK